LKETTSIVKREMLILKAGVMAYFIPKAAYGHGVNGDSFHKYKTVYRL